MIRAPLFAIALSSVSYAACAQPANGTAAGLESCSQLARAAATVCYNQTDSGVERFDCRQARATLGECLESIARSAPLETPEGTGSSEMSSGTIPQKLRPPTVSPNNSTNTGSLSPPYRAVPSKKPSVAVSPDKPTGTVASEKPAAADLIGPRSANENMTGLESCFHAARIADAICSKLPDDPAQRLDCFQQTRAAQLECLEHVLSETPAGPTPPKTPSETTRLEPPAIARLPEGSSERVSPEQANRNGSSEKSDNPPKAIVRTNPQELAAPAETPTGTIRPDIRPKTAGVPAGPTSTNWVVSETTSPVDYSPLVTAVIQSTSPVKDAPAALAIRCGEKHTELMVRTGGTWATTRGNELRVDYQIDDKPAVRLPWSASADGKSASYKGDAVGLLQSLPEGARLKINVFDGLGHDATFQLTGLDTVRKKIAAACNWAPTANKSVIGKR